MGLADWAKGPILQSGLNMAGGLIGHGLSMRAWRKQNEYNTPGRQMDRFRRAGLNPNLIYSQGNPGNAAPPPKADTSTKTGMPDVPAAKYKEGLLASQVDLNEAQAYAALSNAGLNEAKIYEIMETVGFKVENIQADTAAKRQSVIQSKQEVKESDTRISEIEQRKTESQERVLNLAKSRELIGEQKLNTELQNAFDEVRNEYQDAGIAGNKWLQFLYQVAKYGDQSLQNMLIDFMTSDKNTIN
jgi:DNA-binding transcriptional MerR regulator